MVVSGDLDFGRLDGFDTGGPSRRALESIDAVHSADPATLNEPVARLRRFVRIRRPLYYSILAPIGLLSRVSPLLVLLTGGLAVLGAIAATFAGAPLLLIAVLMYWGFGSLSYHALSVRLAALMDEAAASVGLDSADVLAMWQT